jgi:hypothetical protein
MLKLKISGRFSGCLPLTKKILSATMVAIFTIYCITKNFCALPTRCKFFIIIIIIIPPNSRGLCNSDVLCFLVIASWPVKHTLADRRERERERESGALREC